MTVAHGLVSKKASFQDQILSRGWNPDESPVVTTRSKYKWDWSENSAMRRGLVFELRIFGYFPPKISSGISNQGHSSFCSRWISMCVWRTYNFVEDPMLACKRNSRKRSSKRNPRTEWSLWRMQEKAKEISSFSNILCGYWILRICSAFSNFVGGLTDWAFWQVFVSTLGR